MCISPSLLPGIYEPTKVFHNVYIYFIHALGTLHSSHFFTWNVLEFWNLRSDERAALKVQNHLPPIEQWSIMAGSLTCAKISITQTGLVPIA